MIKTSVTILFAQLPIFISILLFLTLDTIANPISYLINISGHISIIFLFVTLLSSRIILLKEKLDRRVLGLASFLSNCSHNTLLH